jgi:hypothetical protein
MLASRFGKFYAAELLVGGRVNHERVDIPSTRYTFDQARRRPRAGRTRRKYHHLRAGRMGLDQREPLRQRRQQPTGRRLFGEWRPGEQGNQRDARLLRERASLSKQPLLFAMNAVKCTDGQYRRLPLIWLRWLRKDILHADDPQLPPEIPTIYYHSSPVTEATHRLNSDTGRRCQSMRKRRRTAENLRSRLLRRSGPDV